MKEDLMLDGGVVLSSRFERVLGSSGAPAVQQHIAAEKEDKTPPNATNPTLPCKRLASSWEEREEEKKRLEAGAGD